MITVCIRYVIDHNKYREFEKYARAWPAPIQRCGGELIGYFLPTRLAGPTNEALALIAFSNLAAYEAYREALMNDPEAVANVRDAEAAGVIIREDRAFVQRIL